MVRPLFERSHGALVRNDIPHPRTSIAIDCKNLTLAARRALLVDGKAALRKKSWGAGEKRYPPSSDQHCNRLQKPNPGRASGPFCGGDAALTPENGASQQRLSDGFQRPNALDLGSDCRIDVLSIPVSLQT